MGRRSLSKATALNAMAMTMTQVVGPAVGGIMISTLGAAAALWVSTAWYALSLALLLPLRGVGHRHEQESRAQHGSTVAMVVSGSRVIAANRLATTTLLVTVAANLLLWPIVQGFMPVLAQRSLGLDADVLGRVLGVQELAIGVMPVASLVLGVAAQRFGISATTFVSAVLLVVLLVALSLWTPGLLGYSGIADDDPAEAARAEVDGGRLTR